MWILKVAVLLFVTVNSAFVAHGQPFKYEEENPKDLVKFYVYTRKNPEIAEALVADVESVVRNIINPSKPTTYVFNF